MPNTLFARLIAFAFIDEVGPFVALFTLWFLDHGISAAQISTVFILWAVVAIVFEVPSGALADRMDRRVLIASSLVLRAAGIALWLVWPTWWGVLIGASLWAVHTSMASGTWEALIYDLLAMHEDEGRYAQVVARIGQASHVGIAAGGLTATFLLQAGVGLAWLGWVTVALHALSFALLASLPSRAALRPSASHGEDDAPATLASWWATLADGVRTALGQRALLTTVIVCALLEGLFVFDEYVPLVGREQGASDSEISILVLMVWVGLVAGGEVAARRPRMGRAEIAAWLSVGVLAMGAAFYLEHRWAVALVGVGYAGMNIAWVACEATLQSRAPDELRATVRSVVGFFSGILSAILFGVVGVLSAGEDPSPGLLVMTGLLGATTLLIASSLPARQHRASS